MERLMMIDDVGLSMEFPYRVSWIFPQDLMDEKIFQDNLSHTLEDLKELVRETVLLEGNQRVFKVLKFDSQKEKQLKLIEENERKISEIEKRMNDGISPYRWRIHKHVDDYFDGKRVIVDYLLVLDRIKYI